MPEQAFDEVFKNGQLVSRTPRTVSDAEIQRRDAPARLRNAYSALRTWSTDADAYAAAYDTMTAAQRQAAQKQLFTRFGRLCDGLADLLLDLGRDS